MGPGSVWGEGPEGRTRSGPTRLPPDGRRHRGARSVTVLPTRTTGPETTSAGGLRGRVQRVESVREHCRGEGRAPRSSVRLRVDPRPRFGSQRGRPGVTDRGREGLVPATGAGSTPDRRVTPRRGSGGRAHPARGDVVALSQKRYRLDPGSPSRRQGRVTDTRLGGAEVGPCRSGRSPATVCHCGLFTPGAETGAGRVIRGGARLPGNP